VAIAGKGKANYSLCAALWNALPVIDFIWSGSDEKY
jgi:hypothetical protein